MGIVQDLRFAMRVLFRKPGLSLVIILTLALGIGSGGAMFSIVHALLLHPVDLPDLDRLAAIQIERNGNEAQSRIPPGTFLDARADTTTFESVAAIQYWEVPMSGVGDPEELVAAQVSPGFFDMLRVKPALGRWFAADEVDGQREHVVILGDRLWERRFHRDPEVLGRSIVLAGDSYTIVGVMPRSFRMPAAAEVWAPLTLTPDQRKERGSAYLDNVARLREGATLADAGAEVRQLGERYAATYPELANSRLRVVSLTHSLSEDLTRTFVIVLFGAALFVLLIACANVANVFLAYALARRKELAVRAALGAGRTRIVRQLVTEAMILGLGAGVVSLLFASWATDLVKGAMPASLIRFVPGWETIGVDPFVLGFALALGLLVGVVFSIVPALQVSRTDVGAVLKDEGRGTTSSSQTHRLRNGLVVAQVALALMLLLGAGALTRGFVRLAYAHEGIDPKNLLTMHVTMPQSREALPPATILAFEGRLLERLNSVPGVIGAAVVNNVPWGNDGYNRFAFPEGRAVRPGEEISVDYRPSSAGYLELLHVRRLEGRGITAADGKDAPKVGVVSAGAAHRLWPDSSPLGKRFRWSQTAEAPWITVVGVVGDVQDRNDEDGPRAGIYVPFEQAPSARMYLILRTVGPPLAVAQAAQAAVFAVDASQPVTNVRTMDMVVAERVVGLRIATGLMGAFALLALLLSAVGIYGVIATLVTQRTHEIGVRMALGAQRGDVLRLILGKGLFLTSVGMLAGLAVGYGLVRFLATLLPPAMFDGDALVFVVFTAMVGGISMAGSLVPALRASRLDPLRALRAD